MTGSDAGRERGNDSASLQALARAMFDRDATLPVIEYEGRWFSYGDMRQVAAGLSAAIAKSGAPPDAAIAFAPRNRPSAVAALLGLIADARSIQTIYPFQSAAAMARELSELKPAVFVAAAQDLSQEVREVASREGIALVALTEAEARAEPGRAHTHGRIESSTAPPCIEVLTSGTTGAPKRLPIPFPTIAGYFTRGQTLFALHGTRAAAMPPVLLFFPLGNITGIYATVPTLLAGLRVVLLDRFTLDGWRDHVRRFQPAHTGMPPSCIQMLLDADVPATELACIKSLGTGAAPLDPNVQRAFEKRYGIPVLLSYGATEFGGRVTAMTAELHDEWGDKKLGSVGRPVYGAKVRVVDPETGSELPVGHEGLLEVVSPNMGSAWIRSTDIGVIDRDGFVFLRGRADGAIARGGFKILPETIERALLLHAAVRAAAIVGLPDRRLGQAPAAAVQLKPGVVAPSAAELEAHLRQHVLATHTPVQWRFVDALPLTPAMKVDRRGVRALFDV